MNAQVDSSLVKHMAQLAQIPITEAEESELAVAFASTLAVVDELKEVEVNQVEPTHQVTGLENVLRSDEVEESRMFSQQEAVANASRTHQGYFVVERVIDAE